MRKRCFAITVLIALSIVAQAQIKKHKKTDEENLVFEKVPIEVSTDEKAWAEHIRRNAILPDSLSQRIPAGTYKIIVQFVVDKMGNLGQIKALNDPGYGLAQRAESAVFSYKGEWQPAIQCGRAVIAYKKQPIVFIIP